MKHSYKIVRIPNAMVAMEYANVVPSWCLSYDAESFDYYTHNGIDKCYYLLRNDYNDVEERRSPDYPKDDYGKSVICLIIDGNGNILNSTSRWNDPDEEVAFTKSEIEEIIGKEINSLL